MGEPGERYPAEQVNAEVAAVSSRWAPLKTDCEEPRKTENAPVS